MSARTRSAAAGLACAGLLVLAHAIATSQTAHGAECDFDGDGVSDFVVLRFTPATPPATPLNWLIGTNPEVGVGRGEAQGDPVLPDAREFGVFIFTDQPRGKWFDPPPAEGFEFSMTDGAVFTSILDFPAGIDPDDRFTVSVEGVELGSFGPGQSVAFTSFGAQLGALLVGGGVARFTVSDIAPPVDASDVRAFPIKLDFDQDTASFRMRAITANAAGFALQKADLLDSTKAKKDEAAMKGAFPAIAAGFDPRTPAALIAFGDAAHPVQIPIAADDSGWKAGKSGAFTWKSAKGVTPKVALAVNAVKGTFDVSVSGFDFAAPLGATFVASFFAGGSGGSSTVTLEAKGKGKFRFRP